MLQSDHQDLQRLLHQLLAGVGEQQVVVRDAVTHRVVAADHVEQGCEERQGVSAAGKQSVKTVRPNEEEEEHAVQGPKRYTRVSTVHNQYKKQFLLKSI